MLIFTSSAITLNTLLKPIQLMASMVIELTFEKRNTALPIFHVQLASIDILVQAGAGCTRHAVKTADSVRHFSTLNLLICM